MTQVFNPSRGREFEASQGYIEIPCLKKKEKCFSARLCRKMLFASSCPEAYVHQVSRFIFLACSSQIPTTPLLMVQICLFLVPFIKFNQMLGLMEISRISVSGLLLPVKCHLKIKFSSREFSGFSVSLKIRYFQLIHLSQFINFSFVCVCLPVLCPLLDKVFLWSWLSWNSGSGRPLTQKSTIYLCLSSAGWN